jgi:hypothetical protein
MVESERERAALDWYEQRRDEFFSAVRHARSRGDDGQVLELAKALAPFLTRRCYWDERETILRWGVDAARRSAHPLALGQMLSELATVHRQQGRIEQAAGELDQALGAFREAADVPGGVSPTTT